MRVYSLSSTMLESVKRSFATRRVPAHHMKTLITGAVRPAVGDMVLARVDELGQHARIELPDGRRAQMFPGDHILVCFGNRYAPDQFEGVIGPDLSPCNLVAAGGIAAIELCRHDRMVASTKISPLGLVGDARGFRLNVCNYGVRAPEQRPTIPVILSLGTSMNAGKTLTATSVMRGLRLAHLKVASLKITGTGAGGDTWLARDAGADMVLDFTDAGFATTYLAPVDAIVRGTFRLLNHAADHGCEVAVIEIADGLQQKETAALLRSPSIRHLVLGVVFSAYDSMGAKCGAEELIASGYTLLGLSGRLDRSPLAVRETEEATGLKVYSPMELQAGALVPVIALAAARRLAEESGSALLQRLAALDAPARSTALDSALLRAAPVPGLRPAILRLIAEHAMLADMDRLCGASPRVRGRGRTNRRNGYRIATCRAATGSLTLRIPRVREGRYRPDLSKLLAADEQYLDVALGLRLSRDELGRHLARIDVVLNETRLAALSDNLQALMRGSGHAAREGLGARRGHKGNSGAMFFAAKPLASLPRADEFLRVEAPDPLQFAQ